MKQTITDEKRLRKNEVSRRSYHKNKNKNVITEEQRLQGNERTRQYYIKNKDGIRKRKQQWYIDNRDRIRGKQLEYKKQWYAENREQNREQKREYNKQYYIENREKLKQRRANRTPEQKTRDRERFNKWHNKRIHTDPEYKLIVYVRNRLNSAIKNDVKSGSSVRDLGCSILEFKKYIESKWLPGMTWQNWTIDGWHLDHIIPLASFNLSDPEQFKTACHYTNYQPLWAQDNFSKTDNTSLYNQFFYEPII